MAQETIFWQTTAPETPCLAPLTEDLSCDVVVIGAGFTGLRTALDLAQAGTDVIVLDAGAVAHGASGRSGGQVNPMLPVDQPETLRKAVGTTYFERMTHAAMASADALFDLIRQNDIPCDARQNGWIRAEHCPRATHVAQKNASLWNAFGADLQVISAQDVQRLSGAQGYRSGILAPKGGAVQPLALTRGLARACLSHGARLFDHSPATNVMRQNGRWRVQVGARTLTADQVILATNGYTDGLWPGLKRSILALHSIQIATDPLPAAQLDPILPQGHTISDTRRLIMYARREPGHQIVFGGIGFCIRRLGRFGFNWLLKDAPRIFPSLRGVTWRYRWGGQIALTPGRVPHLHEPAPGVLAGLGYNGRGVAMSFLMGQQLALRALGTAATDLVFPMTNITPYVGAGFQSAGAGLAMATFRLRDVLDIGGWTGQSLGRDGNS